MVAFNMCNGLGHVMGLYFLKTPLWIAKSTRQKYNDY